MTYDEWKAREPDQFVSFKVGEFDSRAEAEMVAAEYYGEMHTELEERPDELVALWVWE